MTMLQKTKKLHRKLLTKSIFLPLLALTLIFTSCKNDKKEEKQEIEIMDHDKLSDKETPSQTSNQTLNQSIKEEQDKKAIDAPSSFPISSIDHAPVFPGCEGDEKETLDCLSTQVGKFVSKHFKKSIAAEEGLRGTQNIVVSFEINEEGKVQDVQSRAENPRLEKEAKRVISLLPEMKAGLLDGKAVTTQYTVPIKFEVE